MNKKKIKEEPAAGKPEDPKPSKKLKGSVGKELKVKLPSGAEFEGVCTGERKINGGAQVFLRIKGSVARWFNVEDVIK